jgi:replicative DNA helicase
VASENVDAVLQKLKNVKKTSTGWSSVCPGHEDNSNSLSITVGTDGKLLLYCFVGCKFEHILASIGEGQKAEIQEIYPYEDEDEKLLYQVIRKRPKGFSQRRPLPGGKWEWNLKGVRRVPYRLPQLLKSDAGEWVYISEGEKDVDNLRSLGLTSTTNSGGAGKWRSEYSQFFQGRKVCVLPDNDDTGRQHARQVALSLQRYAAEVKVLELPGLPDKGDVTDWLALDGRPETLEEFARGAPLFDAQMELEEEEPVKEAQRDRMPCNPDVEQAVIGNVFLNQQHLSQCKRVTPEWFHVASNRHVWSAILSLDEDGQPIDEVTVSNLLKKRGQLDQCGGRKGVSAMTEGVSESGDIRNYLEILRGYEKARAGIRFVSKLAARLADAEESPDAVFTEAAGWLDSNSGQESRARKPSSLDEMYDAQALRYQLFLKGVSNAIPTGFPQIDAKLLGGGTIPSLTYVFAADPSMGKTTLALDIAANAAEQGKRVYIVSREMSKEAILDRLVAAKSGVDRFKISAGITKGDYEKIMETLSLMRLQPIVLDDTSLTMREVEAELRSLELKGEQVDMLVIDYLQLMEGDTADGRQNEVAANSRATKRIAMRFEIPVIIVSQLNREPARHNRKPTIRDLRESGQIEQDADFIAFIWGDATEEELEFLQKELICRKQRDGPHFTIPMDMNTLLVTFRTPDMLGLTGRNGNVRARRMGTNEEELDKEKARVQGAVKKKRNTDSDKEAFDF